MIDRVSASSSLRWVVMYPCVPRHCPNSRHAPRSDNRCCSRACCTAQRRRSGLRSFPLHVLQDLLLQRQLRYQPTQTTVLFLQLFQPSSLFQLQSAVLFPPAVIGLLGDSGLLGALAWVLWGG